MSWLKRENALNCSASFSSRILSYCCRSAASLSSSARDTIDLTCVCFRVVGASKRENRTSGWLGMTAQAESEHMRGVRSAKILQERRSTASNRSTRQCHETQPLAILKTQAALSQTATPQNPYLVEREEDFLLLLLRGWESEVRGAAVLHLLSVPCPRALHHLRVEVPLERRCLLLEVHKFAKRMRRRADDADGAKAHQARMPKRTCARKQAGTEQTGPQESVQIPFTRALAWE